MNWARVYVFSASSDLSVFVLWSQSLEDILPVRFHFAGGRVDATGVGPIEVIEAVMAGG